MFIAALFTIANIWKHPKYPSVYEWIRKVYIFSGIYSAIKKKETLSFMTTWMNLEGIMLNEMSQTEKDKYCMVSLICGILKEKKSQKLIETESKKWLPEEENICEAEEQERSQPNFPYPMTSSCQLWAQTQF